MIYLAVALLALVALPFMWPHRWLVRDGQKYLLRWPLLGGDGLKRAPWFLGREGTNIYIHLIVLSDGPAVHSHPWSARSRILLGRYRDTRQLRLRGGEWTEPYSVEYGPGATNFLGAGVFHTLQVMTPFVLTICTTEAKHGKGWAFKIGDKVVNASGRGAAAYDEAHKDA